MNYSRIFPTVLALFFGAELAAQETPLLTPPAPQGVVEGDAGITPLVLPFVLDRVSDVDVSFDVSIEWDGWAAASGVDFVAFPAQRLTIPAGQTQTSALLEIYGDTLTEQDEEFRVVVSGLDGAEFAGGDYYGVVSKIVTIVNDDENEISDWVAADDYFVARAGWHPELIDLTANDFLDRDWDQGALTFEMIDPPRQGTFEYSADGRGYFGIEPGMFGAYSFRYRLCLPTACREATATVNVVPFNNGHFLGGDGHSGFREVSSEGLVGKRLTTTPLVRPVVTEIAVGKDLTPGDPWDSNVGTSSRVFTVPARQAGEPNEQVVFVRRAGYSGSLYPHVGIDANGDGELSRAEASCDGGLDQCVLRVVRGQSESAWILRLHNPEEGPTVFDVEISQVPIVESDGSLTATAPTRVSDWAYEYVYMGWNDPTLLPDERRVGIARVSSREGEVLMDLPITLLGSAGFYVPAIMLRPGRTQALALPAGEIHPRLFVEVPEGAQRLVVEVRSDAPGGTPFHLVKKTTPVYGQETDIEEAHDISRATVSGTAYAAGTVLAVEGAQLSPGRWYVVPSNETDTPMALSVTASVVADAPAIRPGSYFNEFRPGSGVFIYPAGAQWTGLWYTYLPNRRPTWYYLQGDTPGADGVMHSRIFRASWDGVDRVLTTVGEVILTPTAADEFSMAYILDGKSGSQPMQSLGRGCPAANGATVDASSTWFDPSRVGTGYSVQLWPDYEYHAAFIYDDQGVPLFLAAERGGFGGDDATMVLQRLKGACPTCAWIASSRSDVGTLRRRISSGVLRSFVLDAVWQDDSMGYPPPPSSWEATDMVQTLGGPGTTQGCAP